MTAPMKKAILFLGFIFGCVAPQAQTYDTIGGRDGKLPHYYYPAGWYDTCDIYYETECTPERYPRDTYYWGGLHVGFDVAPAINPDNPSYNEVVSLRLFYEYHVDEPVAFTGMAVMIMEPSYIGSIREDYAVPDTVFIVLPDTSGNLVPVVSVHTRWDTAEHKVLKLPVNVDSSVYGFRYVYLYEFMFDNPVVVDSVYYIVGTLWNSLYHSIFDGWLHHPYGYAQILAFCPMQYDAGDYTPYSPCHPTDNIYRGDQHGNEFTMRSPPFYYGNMVDWWGPYLLMVDSATIVVESADSAMGTAGPTKERSKWVTQTITATPEYGYRFSHWNDGSTENPRDIYLTQDTHFVAYFKPYLRHTLQTHCVPEGRGIVSGDGLYWDGDSVTMTVTTIAPYIFHHWNDDNQDNPRRIAIEQDTVFIAYLSRQSISVDTVADAETLFTLTPNPTTGSVRCIIGEGTFAGGVLTMTDVSGREVLRKAVPATEAAVEIDLSHLSAGTYFVTLSTPKFAATSRLVVE